MKKSVIFLICLILVCTLMGCEQSDPTATDSQPSTAPSADEPINAPDEALIETLTEYIHNILTEYDMADYNIGIAIDYARGNANAYFVVTDNDAYYYACAYCNSDHIESLYNYDCVDSYIWVRFDSEAEITETYNGSQLAIAFQVNQAQQCRNLKTDENADFGYCQRYKPTFTEGLNTADALTCDKMFIITRSTTPIYYIYDWTPDWYCTLYCTEIDGQFYYKQYVGQKYSDGSISYYQYLDYDFGEYCDALMESINAMPYQEMGDYGEIFGFIGIKDIAQIIRN